MIRTLTRPKQLCALIPAILAIFVLAGCHPNRTVQTKSIKAKATPVKAVQVEPSSIAKTTVQPATVHAFYEAEIHARATGYVTELKADIGKVVKAGHELAILDVPEMKKQREVIVARIKRLIAEEKRANAGVELASAKVESSSAKVSESRSQLQRIEASLAAATAEFNRTQDLVTRGSLQNRMLDESRKKRDSVIAQKQAMNSAVQSATAEVAVTKAQKSAAESDLAAAKAATIVARRELKELEVLIDFATITATIDGIVTQRNVDPGDLVSQQHDSKNANPLFVISQVQTVRIRIPIPESDAALVNPGDKVTLTFPSFTDEQSIETTVARRAGRLNESTRTMIVEADLKNEDGKLLPGMFGQATITLSSKSNANVLPARAVRFREDGSAYIYVINEDKSVTLADVQTGNDTGTHIEITSELPVGTQVVDTHLKRFKSGDKVTVLN